MSLNKLSWIVVLIAVLVCIGVIGYDYNHDINIPSINPTISIITEDPTQEDINEEKIAILSRYIKLRKSTTPHGVADKIAYEIITQCQANNIADDIVVGIIEIESMWNIYAISKAKARGLMQILIEDGVEIDPKKAHDIAYNINRGITIFKSKLKKAKGDVTLALKYYVGGDPEYHKAVYKYLGRYTLYKINNSQIEIAKVIKITKG